MSMRNSPLPEALRSVPVDVIENYVGSQIAMFANGLAHRLGQHGYHIPTDVYKESAREVFQLLISDPSPRRVPQRTQDLQLVFRHDCLALGCLVPSCKLCKHNPSRRCAVNFDKKYLVNDVLKAKCQAVIRVEVVERDTNQPIDTCDLREEMILQMAILDGNTYDAKFEAGMEGDFETCLLLMNNKGSPTLVGTAVSNDPNGFIRVPLSSSRAVLPDLRVTDSSEAMLSGRKPPLRLMMRAVYKDTSLPVPHIRHAISEGFVVATRRTRTAGKVDIPSVDDHVSKLEHMGRETVKKLSDVMEAAHQAGIDDLNLQIGAGKRLCIETVGAFQQLVLAAENDAQLQKKLQQVLKLNKEKWEEARDHALKAVVVDNRMRVWWAAHPGGSSSRIGIVFSCTKGTVDLETPIGLIQEGGKPLFAADWSHAQLEFVRQLQPMALSQWWQPNHTNWDLLEWDSDVFKSSGQLVLATMAESDSHSQCPPSKHGSGIPTSMPKQSGTGAVMCSPLYPLTRDPLDRGMRHPAGGKDGTSHHTVTFQQAHRQSKGASGSKGKNFQMSNSWDWPSAAQHGGRHVSSPADIANGLDDPSGLVMDMQTAFEEAGGGVSHRGPVALDGTCAIASLPGANAAEAFAAPLRGDNVTDPVSMSAVQPGGIQEFGGASRLLSGMSVEGLVHDHGNNILMSRNTSGLDTMQSIEQALPDSENGHPSMVA